MSSKKLLKIIEKTVEMVVNKMTEKISGKMGKKVVENHNNVQNRQICFCY